MISRTWPARSRQARKKALRKFFRLMENAIDRKKKARQEFLQQQAGAGHGQGEHVLGGVFLALALEH
jgi:hypothetical protein